MGYAEDDSWVRADIFRPSGEWYQTIAINMEAFYWSVGDARTHNEMYPSNPREGHTVHDAVRLAYERQVGKVQPGWMVVVTEPYHSGAFPVLLIGGS